MISFYLGRHPVIGKRESTKRPWAPVSRSVLLIQLMPFAFCSTLPLVVNNMKSAYDLLDKRGEIYSSRPRNIMGYVTINFPLYTCVFEKC